MDTSITEAIACLNRGGIIAYPTEAVYGLGCDPLSVEAVTRILQLKHRSIKKGFILIGASWEQLQSLVEPINPRALVQVLASWPGPMTWIFPASPEVPRWIRGDHTTVAIRVTDHPIAKRLCEGFGKPIISTSANVEGYPPLRDARMLHMTFGKAIDQIVEGPVGKSHRPTEMRDAVSGEVIRAG
ncbi:MAG: threonylcarbamoyl-AMP synthase [Gammaproteobacteria bacterium RIFCSPHIGHO2_12_FULL_41_15]|nr:MAG: threonylcarbamoyl-AMP synthase [Gammaproteobacteria bacterium RIFCSPHIGHO2_12_FULL_41_15]